MQLSLKGCAVAMGVLWAVMIARTVVLALVWHLTGPFEFVQQLYFGWISQSWSGLGVGVALGFFNGAVAGAIFALLYNAVARASKRPM